MEGTKEKIHELENKTTEINQFEQQRKQTLEISKWTEPQNL